MTDGTAASLLWAPRAWVEGRWADAVLLAVDALGHWSGVQIGQPAPPHATVLQGPVLPGVVNAHSHAFQRAFAGMAERRDGGHDDFWSWRDRMYGVALRITPGQLQAIATQLYTELLAGGYTQVCEFHYLQHDEAGHRYPDPLAMGLALCQAAAATGIGLTLLPVLYDRAGFAQPALRPEQRRFATTVDDVLALRDAVLALRLPNVHAGVAVHSLRAAAPQSLHALLRRLDNDAGPIHIHIAEQHGEVDDCLAATGARPIEWLTRQLPLDPRWQLVHATHALPAEIDAVARTGAGVVLCPSTEANLGDGLPDLRRWLDGGTPISIGSDSQVCRALPEELRWIEYGQRLLLRQRNVAARPDIGQAATAARLFDCALSGGGRAAGHARWGLQPGARADLLVLDDSAPGLAGIPASHLLDAWVFASASPALQEVWVAGRRVHTPACSSAPATAFRAAMAELWP